MNKAARNYGFTLVGRGNISKPGERLPDADAVADAGTAPAIPAYPQQEPTVPVPSPELVSVPVYPAPVAPPIPIAGATPDDRMRYLASIETYLLNQLDSVRTLMEAERELSAKA